MLTALLAAPLLLTACVRSDQGKKMIQGSTVNQVMRPLCAGRFVLELPDHFDLQPASDLELYFGLGPDHRSVRVEPLPPVAGANAAQRLASQRAQVLKSQHHFRSQSKSMLAAHQELKGGMYAVWGYNGARTTDTVNVEVFCALGQRVARFVATAFQAEPPDQVQARLIELAGTAGLVEPGAENRKGLCLDWLRLDGSWDGEVVNASLRSTRWRDVVMEVVTNSVVQEFDGGLLKRWAQSSTALSTAGFSLRTIRQGPVKIASEGAEELLTDGRESGKLRRDFDAETLPRPSSKVRPHLKMALRLGGQVDADYVDPSLSEAESIGMWDAALASVKLRNGAV